MYYKKRVAENVRDHFAEKVFSQKELLSEFPGKL